MTRLTLNEISTEHFRRELTPIVLTGGGGWLGQAALEMLDGVFEDKLADHVFVFGATPRELRLRSGHRIVSRPLSQLVELKCAPAIFLHFAFLTRDRVSEMSLDAFIAGNRALSALVEETIRRIGARGLFLPSSGAVYRKDRSIEQDIAANPYGVLKYEDEIKFTNLLDSSEAPLVIGRIFNLAGPFINKLGTYALSSIIGNIHRGSPIEIRAAHRVVRSYVDVSDVLDAAFSYLTDAGASFAPICFDTYGDEAIEIGELASRVAAVLHRPDTQIIRPPRDDKKDDIYLGDGSTFQRLVQRFGIHLKSLDQQIMDTADFLA